MMNIVNALLGYSVLILMMYSVFILPKALSEAKGLHKTEANPFFGIPRPRERWTHGIHDWVFFFTMCFIMPIEVYIELETQTRWGLPAAALVIFLIVLSAQLYSKHKSVLNQKIIEAMPEEERYWY